MYTRDGESIIMRTMCPQSHMEMVLSCRREHHVQDNICQQIVYKGNTILRKIQLCSKCFVVLSVFYVFVSIVNAKA